MQKNRINGLIVKTRQEFEVDRLNRATVNPKQFYGYLRQNTRNKDPITLLRTTEGIDLTEDGAKADHFSELFWSVFTKETRYDYPADVFEVITIVQSVQFTETIVLKELLRLKGSKSPGPDEPGLRNCRPVSLTSICCKIMENIIKQQLMHLLEHNHLLFEVQHVFRRGRSCITNLLYCLERWTEAVDRGNMVHAVYIDFKKAFDCVLHHHPLYKINRIGVRGRLLNWIENFLIDHAQTVHISDKQSTKVEVESGVPQGSVLDPILFIVYIKGCANELDCDIAIFADNLKIWRVIQTAADEENLQANVNRLQKWSNDWLLPFNESMCNIIRVGKSNPSNRTVYRQNGILLKEVDAQKDLGVWITPSLKPSLHCAK
ncbi:unnamed protein product, partial [Schistocephalus solidus]|uniref:Reverse transcriptase domain-containing protein n=1 Tax=Schistocephalus solidus TaxID=70667 RepID=A0A183TTH1_SCHSO